MYKWRFSRFREMEEDEIKRFLDYILEHFLKSEEGRIYQK